MRIRSTKPEFWKSRRITSVSWDARLVLKGLESYVDDNGVGIDDIELIVTDVFPRDMFANGRETVARVSEAISELHRAGLVHRYESESDHLLFISFWEEVQRIDKPGKGRNPRPDGTIEYRDSSIRESVASPPETLAPGTGEQGNRGTEEQGSSSSSSEVADATPRPEIDELLDLLDEEIERNGSKKPKRNKANRDAIRLMLDRDGIPASDIAGAIRWCQADDFWRSNILSASKLREKYDQLRLAAQRKKSSPPKTFGQQKQDNTLALINELREEETRGQVGSGDAAGVRQIDSGR